MVADEIIREEKENILAQQADNSHRIVSTKEFIYRLTCSMPGKMRKLRLDTVRVTTVISRLICYR